MLNKAIIKLLNEMKNYIEEVEEKMETEWGDSYSINILIKKKQMPKIYWDIIAIIEKYAR